MDGAGNRLIKPWQVQSAEMVADCRIFQVRKETTLSPRTGQAHEMFVMHHPTWVNIVPLTPDRQVVMVEQWRHGTHTVELETPGGLVDRGETPEACARRELLEETGYTAGSFRALGWVHPNPAIQDNILHYVLATDCRHTAEPTLDHAEDIVVCLVPLDDIPRLIGTGKITHSLVIGAFYWLHLNNRADSHREVTT